MRIVYLLFLITLISFFSCQDKGQIPNEKILLNDGWTIQAMEKSSDSLFSYHKYLFTNQFELPQPGKEQYVTLNFERSNQTAAVSLNSHQIVSGNDLENPYAKRSFSITSQLKENNLLEIEALHTDLANPTVTSLERLPGVTDERKLLIGDVYLKITGNVSILKSEVESRVNTSALDKAWLTVKTVLTNHSNRPVKGKLTGKYDDRSFSIKVKLNPNEERLVTLTSDDIPELFVDNPRIWWCNNIGNPEMYQMELAFETEGVVSDSETLPFTIREVKQCHASGNERAYVLNGKKIFIQGAAWDNDFYYRSTPEVDEIQMMYARDMNLNAIFFSSDRNDIRLPYELCDKYGLLALENISMECDTLTNVDSAPFDYVGACYWYGDSATVKASGFNISASIGAQLPVRESLEKMLPSGNLNLDTLKNNLDNLTQVIEGQYGEITDMNDYLKKADLINYEATKAMFEAYRINAPKATGIVHWKLSSSLPLLYWQLFDYYLVPTSAYYGVKKANIPQQLLYNYKTNTIYYVNNVVTPVERRARISFYGLDSKLLQAADFKFRVEADCSKKIYDVDPLAGNVFMYLQLFDNNDVLLSDNFYCLSAEMEKYDMENSDEVFVQLDSYADYSALNALPQSELEVTVRMELPEDNTRSIKVETTPANDIISFMTRFVVKDEQGNIILPVLWSDNYVAVLPNRVQTVECKINEEVIRNKKLHLYISGWNLPEIHIPLEFE